MTNEEIITGYMRKCYSDEKLAALLAHTEDGKLVYVSCCCFAGFPDARHAYQADALSAGSHGPFYFQIDPSRDVVSLAFHDLGANNETRREALLPLIKLEIARRESLPSEAPEE